MPWLVLLPVSGPLARIAPSGFALTCSFDCDRRAVMTSFHEVRFPDNIAYGATGGPEFATTVVATGAATRSATSTGPRRAAAGMSRAGSRSRRRSTS